LGKRKVTGRIEETPTQSTTFKASWQPKQWQTSPLVLYYDVFFFYNFFFFFFSEELTWIFFKWMLYWLSIQIICRHTHTENDGAAEEDDSNNVDEYTDDNDPGYVVLDVTDEEFHRLHKV
jgi:hypothetical protein